MKNKEISISIIIPTCNRPNELNFLIDSLSKSFQLINKNIEMEIIVSDDSNNDYSKHVIENNFPSVTWIKGPQNGPGANRNKGSRLATKEWLLFIDDDCYVNGEFINAYTYMMKNESINVLEGKIICPNKKNSIFIRQPENSEGGVLPSGNFAIRKHFFEEIGRFDEDLKIMEDMELAYRLRNLGVDVIFCPSAVAYHPAQPKKFSYYYHWVFHFKWQILLNYKCGLKDQKISFITAASNTVIEHIIFLFRITYHLVTKFDKDRWVMYTFERFLAWITLPICLPYLIYWDQLFRFKIRCKKIHIQTPVKS